jgi:hypothetical protein
MIITITEHIRSRLLDRAGVFDIKTKTDLSPIEIVDQEMDWDFLTEMAYGMMMGYFRYGRASDSNIDNLSEIKKRVSLYEETGNQEYLRDAANFAMQERKRPSIKGTYFKAIDDGVHGVEIK